MSTDFKKLKKGERLSFTNYVIVDKVNKRDGSINVTTSTGQRIQILGEEIIKKFQSNTQHTKTKKLGKNALAEVLQNAGVKIFTVEFVTSKGDDRTLTGYYLSSEANLGRSNVIDLEATGHNMRQVDHRTIKSIIIDGTKYVAK
jgi:hypothetical protein